MFSLVLLTQVGEVKDIRIRLADTAGYAKLPFLTLTRRLHRATRLPDMNLGNSITADGQLRQNRDPASRKPRGHS